MKSSSRTPKKQSVGKRRTKKAEASAPLVPEVLPPEEGDSTETDQLEVRPKDISEEPPLVEVLPAEEDDPALAQDNSETEALDDTKSVVPYDALGAYLREIQRHPPITREEEHALAVRYLKNRDVQAARKLVVSTLWLVVKIARDYERAARNVLDLIQEGNIGLLEAVKNFDPYRGVRFPSYAVWWIRAYIIRYIIANWRMVKIGTTQAQRKLFFNLKKEKERLEREGFYPAPKLLAEKLDVKESEIVEMEQRLSSPDMSVDAPVEEGQEGNLLSILPSDQASVEDIVAQKQMMEQMVAGLDTFASTLRDKEEVIFRERILGDEKATLQELADKLSLSKERVRQIENKVRDKLKDFLSERFGTSIDNLEF